MRLSDLNWKQPPYVYLSERVEDDYVAITPSRNILYSFTLLIFLSYFIERLSPGIEPCSLHSQCSALPDKLKTTLFSLRVCASFGSRTRSNKSIRRGGLSVALTSRYSRILAYSVQHTTFQRVCSLYQIWTDILRKAWDPEPLDEQTISYRRQDSNLQPPPSRWSIRPNRNTSIL